MSEPSTSASDLVDQAIHLAQGGDDAAAERQLRAALELDPEHHRALAVLGMTLIDRDPPAAVDLLEHALWLSAEVAWYFLALGNAYAKVGKDAHAVAAMQKAALMDPASDAPHYDLARHYLQRHQPDQALAALRQVLAIRPDHPQATYLVASLTGAAAETAPAAYVAELFDSYAPTFERHLVDELQYHAPTQLAAMVAADGGPRAWQALDLGCGSGLAGVAFRPLTRHLVGSDLSRRMIEQARARGVYDELVVEDLVTTLGRARGADLVIATDVFIYVGALEPVFAATAAALRPGGRFAFSTETHDGDGDGVVLRPTSRYAHADRYIRDLAARHGFEVRRADDITLRVDHGVGIAGALYLLVRAA